MDTPNTAVATKQAAPMAKVAAPAAEAAADRDLQERLENLRKNI